MVDRLRLRAGNASAVGDALALVGFGCLAMVTGIVRGADRRTLNESEGEDDEEEEEQEEDDNGAEEQEEGIAPAEVEDGGDEEEEDEIKTTFEP